MATGGRHLRFNVYPTRAGAMVVVVDADWGDGSPVRRERARLDVDLGEPLSLDDPAAALRALSDALASLADTFPTP